METYPKGKRNQASCGMSPELIFSTKNYKKPRNEHCKVKSTYSVEVFEEFYIDFEKKKISYKKISYLSEYGKRRQTSYYIKKGDTKEEAERKTGYRRETSVNENIDKVFLTKILMFQDPITGKFLHGKYQTVYNIFFNDRFLQIAEFVPESALSKFNLYGSTSWLSMRFGK